MLSIMDSLTKLGDDFKNWIMDNGSNPILWFGLLAIGFLVFFISYNALSKR